MNGLQQKRTGVVKVFYEKKGFGFIVDDETKEEIFVHVSGLIDEITEGDLVIFDLKEEKRGYAAYNVKLR